MSHEATNWAIKQRGIAPAAKIVLWHLCDRFNRELGCFAGQELLAEDCEMSRSALNEHLAALEEAGLVKRERRFDARTKQRRSTRYRFPFEPGWPFRELHEETAESSQKPCPDSGQGAMSGNDPEPCPDSAESHVRNPDTNPVREPGREPFEREGARASGEGAQAAPAVPDDAPWLGDESFMAFMQAWPTSAADGPIKAWAVWRRLTDAERRAAIDGVVGTLELRDREKRGRTIGPDSYLTGRNWLLLPPEHRSKAAVKRDARSHGLFLPFGREWWWLWLAAIVQDPAEANRRARAALNDRLAWRIGNPDRYAEIEYQAKGLVGIPVNGREFAAWAGWYRAQGRELPRPDKAGWAFLPAQWPPGAEGETATADERSEV